jgi:hypothetical protein
VKVVTSALLVAVCCRTGSAQCVSSQAAKTYPRVPFDLTAEKKIVATGYTNVLAVPVDRIAVIETVAVKGTQSAGTYLAIELKTVIKGMNLPVPQIPGFPRHFLFARRSSESAPVHIRETTKIYASDGTYVQVGVQSSAPSIEPFSVTLSGVFIDKCAWGQ